MTFTFCTSGAAINKAGVNANATIVASGTAIAAWMDEAESIICDIARVDLITNYSSLTTNGKSILSALASAIVGQRIIGYEPGAIGQNEATLRLNNLENDIDRNIALIKDDKIKTYLSAT